MDNDMYAFWVNWFDQPDSVKYQHLRQPGKGGWYPPQSESPGFTGNKDDKEYFHFRPHHFKIDPSTAAIFMESYSAVVMTLAQLGYEHLIFSPEHSTLRILKYVPKLAGLIGEAHKDFDIMTVLWKGTRGEVEVQKVPTLTDPEDVWEAVSGEVPKLLLGEMFEIYTKGQCLADTHRVMTYGVQPRYSMAFFYLPPMDFKLREDLTADEYLKETLTKAGTYYVGT